MITWGKTAQLKDTRALRFLKELQMHADAIMPVILYIAFISWLATR
jgi:hypothetical protein